MLVGWELIDTKCLGWAGPRESQWECEVEVWAVGSPLGGGRWRTIGGVEGTREVPGCAGASLGVGGARGSDKRLLNLV
jgi:hypothetical protein